MARMTALALLFVFLEVVAAQERAATCWEGRQRCIDVLEAGGVIEDCERLRIPPGALPDPPLRPVGYSIHMLRPGVFVFSEGIYNWMIAVAPQRVMVFDFPPSFISTDTTTNITTNNLVAGIKEAMANMTTAPQNIDMVYTHEHLDHIGGAMSVYNYLSTTFANATLSVHSSVGTREAILRTSTKQIPIPDNLFTRNVTVITLREGLNVQMRLTRGPHSEQDLIIWIPPVAGQGGVVMLVDVVEPRWAPFSYFAISADIVQYLFTHDDILALNFDYFVGGHVTTVGNRTDVENNRQLMIDIMRAAIKGDEEGVPDMNPAETYFNPQSPEYWNIWGLSVSTRNNGIDICIQEVFAKWACKMAGWDVVVRTHCDKAVYEAAVNDYTALLDDFTAP